MAYDLIVLGGGPAGYLAAERAGHAGMSVLLFEERSLGGVCRQLIGTGQFISGFVSRTSLPLGFLPFLIFIIAALMSFSMGTSWGTF